MSEPHLERGGSGAAELVFGGRRETSRRRLAWGDRGLRLAGRRRVGGGLAPERRGLKLRRSGSRRRWWVWHEVQVARFARARAAVGRHP
jgi:hypothetical protein